MGFSNEINSAIKAFTGLDTNDRANKDSKSKRAYTDAKTAGVEDERAATRARAGAHNEQSSYYKYLRGLQSGQAPGIAPAAPAEVPQAVPLASGPLVSSSSPGAPYGPEGYAEGGLVHSSTEEEYGYKEDKEEKDSGKGAGIMGALGGMGSMGGGGGGGEGGGEGGGDYGGYFEGGPVSPDSGMGAGSDDDGLDAGLDGGGYEVDDERRDAAYSAGLDAAIAAASRNPRVAQARAQAVPTAQPTARPMRPLEPKPPRGMQYAPREPAIKPAKQDPDNLITPEIRRQFDPTGKNTGASNIMALGAAYLGFKGAGNADKADEAATQMLGELQGWADKYQKAAAQLLKRGDLDGAARMMVQSYDYVPNGFKTTFNVVTGEDGRPRIAYSVSDERSGKQLWQTIKTPEEVFRIAANGMTPDEFKNEIITGRKFREKMSGDEKKDEGVKLGDRDKGVEAIDTSWGTPKEGEVADPATDDLKAAAYHVYTANKNLHPTQAKKIVMEIARPTGPGSELQVSPAEGGVKVRVGKGAPVFVPQDQFDELIALRSLHKNKPAPEPEPSHAALRYGGKLNPMVSAAGAVTRAAIPHAVEVGKRMYAAGKEAYNYVPTEAESAGAARKSERVRAGMPMLPRPALKQAIATSKPPTRSPPASPLQRRRTATPQPARYSEEE